MQHSDYKLRTVEGFSKTLLASDFTYHLLSFVIKIVVLFVVMLNEMQRINNCTLKYSRTTLFQTKLNEPVLS